MQDYISRDYLKLMNAAMDETTNSDLWEAITYESIQHIWDNDYREKLMDYHFEKGLGRES